MAKQTNYIAKTPDANGVINYSEEELSVWSDLFKQQQANIQQYAADVYLDGLEKPIQARQSLNKSVLIQKSSP